MDNRIISHYEQKWQAKGTVQKWLRGPVSQLPPEFTVLEVPPHGVRTTWTYATCGMSTPDDAECVELHLFSPVRAAGHVELLTVVAHFHRTGSRLGRGHTVNFGRPWLEKSRCQYGLVSLPYLDGPEIEDCRMPSGKVVKCLWLVPITKAEVGFKAAKGLEALEDLFDQRVLDYANPQRLSLV